MHSGTCVGAVLNLFCFVLDLLFLLQTLLRLPYPFLSFPSCFLNLILLRLRPESISDFKAIRGLGNFKQIRIGFIKEELCPFPLIEFHFFIFAKELIICEKDLTNRGKVCIECTAAGVVFVDKS